MSASAVRAGKAFVEITANDTDFQRGMKRVQHSVVRLGNMMRQVGSGMAIAGGAMGLPMVMAARSAATFEDALLELQGAAGNLSGGDLRRVREEALRLSQAMGIAPESVAQAFALLVKAGMEVEDALNGGAKAAVEFARVSGVDATQAAEFMSDAMKVFRVSASEAADTLSAAADSSSTSIASMVESFALVASVAKGTGQTLFGISQGFAALAQYGIKGEEAGTGIKTMLLKLVAPSNEAKEALATLGISMGDLVDKSGTLLPLAQLSAVFRKAMAGMDQGAREAMLANEALVKVFDVRGIRVIQAFADIGEDGFNRIAKSMETSRTVSEKFDIAMSGITGSFEKLYSSVKRMAIAFMVGAAPALSMFAAAAVPVMDALSFILTNVPFIAPILATMATALFGLGMAALFTSGLLAAMNFSLKNIINFKTTFVAAVRAMTSVIGGMSLGLVNLNRQLLLLKTRIYAIPGWGWALAGLAVVGGAVAYAFSGSKAKAKPKGSGIKRDEAREALGGADAAAMAAAGPKARGESLATFSASIAAQLGIGPALTAQEQTADNTGRMADGVDALVRQGEARVPGAVLERGGNAAADRAKKLALPAATAGKAEPVAARIGPRQASGGNAAPHAAPVVNLRVSTTQQDIARATPADAAFLGHTQPAPEVRLPQSLLSQNTQPAPEVRLPQSLLSPDADEPRSPTIDLPNRIAAGVDALVKQGGLGDRRGPVVWVVETPAPATVPNAAALQAGMASPGVRGGVAARSDRDLVSMSERAAIAAEESRGYLRQLVEKARNGGLAFA